MAALSNTENPKFTCEKCQTITNNKKDYKKHLLTSKHLKMGNPQQILQKKEKKSPLLNCSNCLKQYESRSGLWRHRRVCATTYDDPGNVISTEITLAADENERAGDENENAIVCATDAIQLHIFDKSSNEIKVLTNLVLEIVKSNNELQKQNTEIQKQHTELQKQIIDVCKSPTITNMNINSNNTNHKTFNLQFFLNEQCKDAMNISDFANSFDLQLSDLESVGELGYVEGITKIMVDKLNSMDIYKRPIHCSDAKREIIYVKDENVWTKEAKDNPKLRQAIKNVSFRNMKLVYNWSNKYPESKDNESRLNDKYMTLVIESTGGKGPILENENKIIRRIAREIVIGKKNNLT